ncbi:hypothetical protein IEQ34_017130 [Dendrobium chrysotoxum]|uniref:Uncharacterized protein n=1 Tax=Dendrobium chrysotoxum TaxID=161865 RepID=A0AAV7G8Q3_DENCH|nr:hypothetical protein IEQ34_017130 [Dendrobium chrysotoxum]
MTSIKLIEAEFDRWGLNRMRLLGVGMVFFVVIPATSWLGNFGVVLEAIFWSYFAWLSSDLWLVWLMWLCFLLPVESMVPVCYLLAGFRLEWHLDCVFASSYGSNQFGWEGPYLCYGFRAYVLWYTFAGLHFVSYFCLPDSGKVLFSAGAHACGYLERKVKHSTGFWIFPFFGCSFLCTVDCI